MKYMAAGEVNFGKLEGFGTLGTPSGTGIEVFSKFISSTIGLMTIIAIVWFVFVFFTGAISWISAGGDKQALESARKKIYTGIIGIVVVVSALFLIKLVGAIIGIPNILNINQLFSQITQ